MDVIQNQYLKLSRMRGYLLDGRANFLDLVHILNRNHICYQPGCTTCGKTEADALAQAVEALGGHLWAMEENNEEIPAPSSLQSVAHDENESVILVSVYMPAVRLAEVNRSVSRTVTLPAWMNAAAQARKINFSQVLQEALRARLAD